MAWIESHQELGRHPKTRRLARALGETLPSVVGRLQFLWWWALDYAEDGDLGGYSDEDIADAALWEGEPSVFVAALTASGFLEEDRHIHDWWEYAQRWIEKRRANAERMRAARAKPVPDTESPRATHVPRTLRARAGATGPNLTKPDLTGPEPETRDDARTVATVTPPKAKATPKKAGRNLAPLIDAFREMGLPEPVFLKGEGPSASDLLGHYSAQEIAECWQDHATGDFGDGLTDRMLSFGYLANYNRIGNWQRWKQAQRSPPSTNGHAIPVTASRIEGGRTLIPKEPGIYQHGVRCDCGEVYSRMRPDCPRCAQRQTELTKVTA